MDGGDTRVEEAQDEGAWVEGHRVEEAWPTFSNLTSPSRESVPLPLSQTDFFFLFRPYFFPQSFESPKKCGSGSKQTLCLEYH